MKTVVCSLLLSFTCAAQELARRPFLGIQMSRVTDDTRRVMKLEETKGVLIEQVFENSTAAQAGFKKGDVLLSINEQQINSPDEGVKTVGSLPTGSKFSYTLIRDHKIQKGKATITQIPFEKHEGLEMVYTSVKTVNGLQRLIVSKGAGNAKRPALIFIGGIGCYSLDFPFEPERSEVQLLNTLSRAGYVCIRAEKPGVGDNRNCTPCAEVSFMNEAQGYVEAVKKVKSLEYVDSSQVYIFGHSMGGVMAPVVARQQTLKGIIAFGTIGCNFPEYLAKTRRTLAAAYGMNPEETDSYIKDYCECASWYFVDGLSTEQAAARKKDCREYLGVFDYRSPQYNKELYGLNIPAQWKEFRGRALLMYGDQDFVASREDHEIIAATVNHYHKGTAETQVIGNASHGMTAAGSYQEALKGEGRYQPSVAEAVLTWLKKSS